MGLRFRLNDNSCCFFITTTVVEFRKIFTEEKYLNILAESLKFCRDKYGFKLLAYVFMPSHIHLVVWPKEGSSVSNFMRDFKKFTSKSIKDELEARKDPRLKVFKAAATGRRNQEFKLWMDRFDCVGVYSRKVLDTKANYIHYNPVEAGLSGAPEGWEYSSASAYILGKRNPVEVDVDCYPI
jgi:REP element-mobilizing transposase RayT